MLKASPHNPVTRGACVISSVSASIKPFDSLFGRCPFTNGPLVIRTQFVISRRLEVPLMMRPLVTLSEMRFGCPKKHFDPKISSSLRKKWSSSLTEYDFWMNEGYNPVIIFICWIKTKFWKLGIKILNQNFEKASKFRMFLDYRGLTGRTGFKPFLIEKCKLSTFKLAVKLKIKFNYNQLN